jgi:2-polyprenyl-6-methoxyphenol hydroxylase-like FAD-dependent oxidoreductase
MRRTDSNLEHFDAIVVGARVAGAATAMLLARQGQRVLLVDRRRPGSDTLSTHALMRGGVLQLARWGLLDRVAGTGAQPIRRTTFHYGDSLEEIELKPSAGIAALYAPRRHVLDGLLVDAAAEAGVDVRFGVSVHELLSSNSGRVRGILGRTRSGGSLRAQAPITVGADGLRSLVAGRAGAATERQGGAAGAIIYSYWSGRQGDGYEWFYRPGVSAGLIPTNDGQTCAWVGMPSARFTREVRRDLAGAFSATLRQAAPEAAALLESESRRESTYYGFPGVPGFLRRPCGRGWALVGDASHFKDPLSAHGMTDALRDAELLANAITAHRRGAAGALESYARTRDRLSLPLHDATDRLAAYRWNLDEVRELLLELSAAMKAEIEELESLDNRETRTAA